MNAVEYEKAAEFYKAFSHPVRVEIIAELLKDKKCVNDIRSLVKVKQANVSQHLTLLRLHDIVGWCQEGKRKCYFLKNPQLVKTMFKLLGKLK